MSDIPKARQLIRDAHRLIATALKLLDREKPEFVAPAKLRKLTPEERERCRQLRQRGMAVNDIARMLGTNHGRVSEAINGRK